MPNPSDRELGMIRESSWRDFLNGMAVAPPHYGPVAAGSVLACWNEMLPYLCPELPQEQRKALSYGVKARLAYTSGVSSVTAPGSYHPSLGLGTSLRLGGKPTYRRGHRAGLPRVRGAQRALGVSCS